MKSLDMYEYNIYPKHLSLEFVFQASPLHLLFSFVCEHMLWHRQIFISFHVIQFTLYDEHKATKVDPLHFSVGFCLGNPDLKVKVQFPENFMKAITHE